MKRSLDAETMRHLLDYEPDTGIFYWRIQPSRSVKAGAVAGSVRSDDYIGIMVNGTRFMAHRLAWLHFHGVWPEHQIDHIDENKSNNRILNLRDVPQSMNQHNAIKPRKDGTFGYRGVSWHKNKKRWHAHITVSGRQKHLGLFNTPEAAHAAYLAAKLRLHPGDIRNLAEIQSLPTTLFERTA